MGLIILVVIYLISVVTLFIHLLLSGVKPVKMLAWVLVLFLIPFVGIFLYLTFGINRRRHKFVRLTKHKEIERYHQKVDRFYQSIEQQLDEQPPEIQSHLKLSRLVMKSARFMPIAGNQVKLLVDGPDTFAAIIDAIESARRFIHLQYYIFEEGELADQLLAIFEKKRKAGVEIRLIYDGIGSRKLSRKYLRRLAKAGVEAYSFLPLRFGPSTFMINYRNHRKLVVVDGKVGFTGGINVADKYLTGDHKLGKWHDLHLIITGPGVNNLQAVFAMDWYNLTGKETLLNRQYFPTQSSRGDSTLQIVTSGPDSDFSAIHQHYFSIINQAEEYVYIASPYLSPGEAMLEALQTTALSGVDVQLMVPQNSDSKLTKWSMRAFFLPLLEAGVKIHLYNTGFLHGKYIVADDSIASIGTANLDMRSFEQNFEINAIIYDEDVARELAALFQKDRQQSQCLDLTTYQQRSRADRMKEGMAKLFSPML